MKIYVVYADYDTENCSEPLSAFDSEDKARRWIDQQEDLMRVNYIIAALELNPVRPNLNFG